MTRRLRIRRMRVAALLVVLALLAAALADRGPGSSSSTAVSTITNILRGEQLGTTGALGQADGAVPDGTTVFDDGVPGVANLDPELLAALRRAANDAAGDGVGLIVDSGWRSRAYQEHLLQEAIGKYGSREEAARWVATPDTSAHVSGHAVDVGSAGAAWLAVHGAVYGLCQIYDNEPWHFELRPDAFHQGCPARYADAAHDPRTRR